MDTEFPSFIGAGGDNAAAGTLFGVRSDDDGFVSEFGVIFLFNRRVEGVHVDM